jgi:hypothetical protein
VASLQGNLRGSLESKSKDLSKQLLRICQLFVNSNSSVGEITSVDLQQYFIELLEGHFKILNAKLFDPKTQIPLALILMTLKQCEYEWAAVVAFLRTNKISLSSLLSSLGDFHPLLMGIPAETRSKMVCDIIFRYSTNWDETPEIGDISQLYLTMQPSWSNFEFVKNNCQTFIGNCTLVSFCSYLFEI